MFTKFLFPQWIIIRMADESNVSVTVESAPEGEEEKKAEPTVVEQAAKIVETATDLAKEIAKPEEQLYNIVQGLAGQLESIRDSIMNLQISNETRHAEIFASLEEIKMMVEDVEEEVEENNGAPKGEPSGELPTATAEPVPDVADLQPEKRDKKRRWL